MFDSIAKFGPRLALAILLATGLTRLAPAEIQKTDPNLHSNQDTVHPPDSIPNVPELEWPPLPIRRLPRIVRSGLPLSQGQLPLNGTLDLGINPGAAEPEMDGLTGPMLSPPIYGPPAGSVELETGVARKPPGSSVVPEPGTAVLLGLLAAGVLRRRR